MPKVEIYTTMMCPYCFRAKKLLDKKQVRFKEYDVSIDRKGREAMRSRAGGVNSVPQIFIDGQHIGGCDDLYALDAKGGLDPLLAAAVG
ncbi:glutaredoxin 3 [Rhodovibrionaceae bacterium A322]